jgi:hypothetical protein
VLQCELATETLQLRYSRLQDLLAGGGPLLGEGLFATGLVLLAPSQQHALGEVVLAAELGGRLWPAATWRTHSSLNWRLWFLPGIDHSSFPWL